MQFLDSRQTASKLVELIAKHRYVAFAVAWASHKNKVFESLKRAQDKIKWGVIGTHFSNTHWKVLEWCMKLKPEIGFIFSEKTNIVFHPKVYVLWTGREWDLLIGSANLTMGGTSGNAELMLHLSSQDPGTHNIKNSALDIIRSYWRESHYISRSRLEKYRERWDRERAKSKPASGENSTVEILSWSWKKYYATILKESKPKHKSRKNALLLLQRAREMFDQGRAFHEFDYNTRKALAGSTRPKDGEWADIENGWFGFTYPNGYFTQIIYDNVDGDQLRILGEGLGYIPNEGPVYRDDYLNYIERFKKALAEKPHGLGVGARLITIKRPDTFMPWNSGIKATLEQYLNLKTRIKPNDYERYWDEVVVPISESEWCDSPQPKENQESEIWRCRVAMLDVLGWNDR